MAALQVLAAFRGLLAFGFISSLFIAVNGQFDISSCDERLTPTRGTAANSDPFIIATVPATWSPGDTIAVYILSLTSTPVSGFIVQARVDNGDIAVVGTWTDNSVSRTLTCPGGSDGNSVTNINERVISSPVLLVWTAPDIDVGPVFFIATIFNGDTGQYWQNTGSTVGDPCQPNPCRNNGGCSAVGNAFSCACVGDFTGNICDIRDRCQPNPCQNNGVCFTVGNDFSCACVGGFTGNICATPAAGIQCPADLPLNVVLFTIPDCPPGSIIETAFCDQPITFPTGVTTVTCRCFGATTLSCEFDVTVTDVVVNECQPNPCQNGGICFGNPFSCACVGGFTGPTCAISALSPCAPNPCQNGGICSPAGTTFSCLCVGLFAGTTCTARVDTGPACASNPCMGGNECRASTSAPAGYTCHSSQGIPCLL